jgi:hypothetical protein
MEVATVSKNTITRVLPSKLVSVMLSCRCPAAFCLFALSIAKPHDDLRGLQLRMDAGRPASLPACQPSHLTCSALYSQRDMLFCVCLVLSCPYINWAHRCTLLKSEAGFT